MNKKRNRNSYEYHENGETDKSVIHAKTTVNNKETEPKILFINGFYNHCNDDYIIIQLSFNIFIFVIFCLL